MDNESTYMRKKIKAWLYKWKGQFDEFSLDLYECHSDIEADLQSS